MQQKKPPNIYNKSIIFGALGFMFYISGGFVYAYILWLISYATFPIIKKADDKKNTNVDKKTINNAIIVTNIAMSLFIFHAITNFIARKYVPGGVALVVLLILYGYFFSFRNKNKNTNNKEIDQKISQQKNQWKEENTTTVETPIVYTETKQRNIFYNLPNENEQPITTPKIPSFINTEVKTNTTEISPSTKKTEITEDEYIPAQDLEQLHNTIKNLNAQPFVKAELNSVIRDLERLKSNAAFGAKPIHFIIFGNNEKGKILMSQIITDLFRLNGLTNTIKPQNISIHHLSDKDTEENNAINNFTITQKQKVVIVEDIDLSNKEVEQTVRQLVNTLNDTTTITLILNVPEKDSSAIESLCRQNRNVQFRKLHIA